MGIFEINFLLIFIWALIVYALSVHKDRKQVIYLAIIFVQFVFLSWQRDFTVGQDTQGYYEAYRSLANNSLGEALHYNGWEPGYVLWNWIMGHIFGANSNGFHTYLLFTALFINFSVLNFIKRYSQCVWLSVAVYVAFGYFFSSLHILRQYIALSIILFSYRHLIERNFVKFLLLVVLAGSFHFSAFPFLLTYWLCNRKIMPVPMLIIFFLSLVVSFIAGRTILGFLVVNDVYVDRYLDDGTAGSGYGMLAFMFMLMLVLLILKPKKPDRRAEMFYWIFFIALCLQPLATVVSMVSRGILYWSLSATVLLPMIINRISDAKLRLMAYIIVLAGVFYLFNMTNSQEGKEVWATYTWYSDK